MFKSKEQCNFDAVSLGEVMLRLDPGDERIRAARSFRVCEGGGEYNVARGLRKCFGLKTAVITGLPKNDVGLLIEDLIMQGGVDVSHIKWYDYDGIGRSVRAGLNFTERGFGVRGALGVSDRANSGAARLTEDDIDFKELFSGAGTRLLHTGGIYAALSEVSAKTALAAVKAAKDAGTVVSYDLNYRPSLWQYTGGFEAAARVNGEIVKHVDILIGNEEDYSACLGLKSGFDATHLDKSGYKKMLKEVMNKYTQLKAAAVTLRTVKTATVNDWTAMCATRKNGATDCEITHGMEFNNLEIYDRVGGGDSFASGFLYGLMEDKPPEFALNCGICHGALAMTTIGDTSRASFAEVEGLMKGKGARVIR